MRISMHALALCFLLAGCHKDGDHPIVCIDLNEGAFHQAVIQVARSLSEAGFWKIERSLPSRDGSRPNIGLYRLDNTKVYLTGERIARDGSIWPRAGVSFYGNADNEKLTEWVNLTLDLLDANDLTFEAAGCVEEAQERTARMINEWRSRRAQEEDGDETE